LKQKAERSEKKSLELLFSAFVYSIAENTGIPQCTPVIAHC